MGHFDEAGLVRVAESLHEQGSDVLRLGYPDLIGTERGRDLLVSNLARTAGSGVAFCRSVYATSPMGDVIPIDGGLADGLPDVIAFPDLDTVRALPWEPGVTHCIADVYNPDGSPSAESPRNVLRRVIERFAELGQQPLVGPELEFFVLERDSAASTGWKRYGEASGNVYVAGRKGDPQNLLLRSLRQLEAYDIGVVAGNHEFSSGQFEINLWHCPALTAADNAFRFKSAVKELARLEDKLATFMAKPFNDEGGSGFHLHLSTVGPDGSPLFDDPDDPSGCRAPPGTRSAASSRTPRHWPRCSTRPSTPTSGSGRTRWPPGSSTGAWTTAARCSGFPRSAAPRPGWNCDSAMPAPTPTSPSPRCWPGPTSESATRSSRRRRYRATAMTPARPSGCRPTSRRR